MISIKLSELKMKTKIWLGWEPRSGSDTFADQEFLKLPNSDSLALRTLENWLKFAKCAKKKVGEKFKFWPPASKFDYVIVSARLRKAPFLWFCAVEQLKLDQNIAECYIDHNNDKTFGVHGPKSTF